MNLGIFYGITPPESYHRFDSGLSLPFSPVLLPVIGNAGDFIMKLPQIRTIQHLTNIIHELKKLSGK